MERPRFIDIEKSSRLIADQGHIVEQDGVASEHIPDCTKDRRRTFVVDLFLAVLLAFWPVGTLLLNLRSKY